MSDIISARCFGCGHTIKVPVGLGGKKARCPQCTNTITIPNPNDTQAEDIVSDADLPEVAIDGEKFVPEEGDAPHPDAVSEPPAPEDSPSERGRRMVATPRRSGGSGQTSTSHPRIQPRGTQTRPAGGQKPAAAPASNNQAMIIGIALGVVALLIVAFVVMGKKDPAKSGSSGGGQKQVNKEKDREKEKETPKQPQYSPEDQALVTRALEYAETVNRGDAASVMRFYTYDPEEERKTRIRATEIVDAKTTYDKPQISSVSAANGTTTFTYGGGKTKSLQWKQVDGVWMIAEKPTP